MFQVQMGMNFI